MKKLLFSLSLLASLATFAAESSVEASAQVFGVLPVTSSATDVIVSVPWVASSASETNLISVAEIIKTANLTENDWIRVWDEANKKFRVWELKSEGGILVWKPGTVVDGKGQASSGTSADTFLKRWDALILHRQSPGTFYVIGQYTSADAGTKTCAKAAVIDQKVVPAYTLIAPPGMAEAQDFAALSWSNIGSNDFVTVEGPEKYVYNDTNKEWGYWTVDAGAWVWKKLSAEIARGSGFWYVANTADAEDSATVQYSK